MQDRFTPNVLKSSFSKKIIQIKCLAALSKNQLKENPEKKFHLLFLTPSGTITGDYSELYCSDENDIVIDNSKFDISKIDELANKVLIDAENELINISLVDNSAFVKLINVTITNLINDNVVNLDQLLVYADQITAFSLVEVK